MAFVPVWIERAIRRVSTKRKPALAIVLAGLALGLCALFAIRACSRQQAPTLLPVALPLEVSLPAIQDALAASGLEPAASEYTVLLPLSDFSAIRQVSVADAITRLRAGDPRCTPLSDALPSLFRTAPVSVSDGEHSGSSMRIVYLNGRQYKNALKVLKPFGALAITNDAQPGSAWLVVVPLCAAVALALQKPRKPLVPRLAAHVAWLPFVFFPLTGWRTVMALCVQAIAAHTLSAWHEAALDQRKAPKLAAYIPALPYGISLVLLFVSDTGAWLPLVLSCIAFPASIALGLFAYRKSQARQGIAHRVFVPIHKNSALRQALAAWFRTFLAACCAMVLGLFVASGAVTEGGAIHAVLLDLDSEHPLKDHRAFQEALTFGRLGSAQWGSSSYESVPGRNIPTASVYKQRSEPEYDGRVWKLDALANNGQLYAWQLGAGFAHVKEPVRLATKSWFFYIMSLAPLWGSIAVCLAIMADGPSRGKIGQSI